MGFDAFPEATAFFDVVILKTGWILAFGAYANNAAGQGNNHLIVEYDGHLFVQNAWGLYSVTPGYVEATYSVSLFPWTDDVLACGQS